MVRPTATNWLTPRVELFAVPRHDEEAVVDREAEAERGGEVQREDRDRGEVRQDREHHERAEDREHADREWQERGDDAAEHEDERDEDEWRREDFGAVQVLLGPIADLLLDRGLPGDLDADRAPLVDEARRQLRRVVDALVRSAGQRGRGPAPGSVAALQGRCVVEAPVRLRQLHVRRPVETGLDGEAGVLDRRIVDGSAARVTMQDEVGFAAPGNDFVRRFCVRTDSDFGSSMPPRLSRCATLPPSDRGRDGEQSSCDEHPGSVTTTTQAARAGACSVRYAMPRRRELADALHSVPLFARCSPASARTIARFVETATLPAGTGWSREGEDGDALFVILEGEAVVKTGGRERRRASVPETTSASWRCSTASRGRPTWSPRAESRSRVLGVRMFRTLVRELPDLAEQLLAGLASELHAARAVADGR